MFDLFRFKPVVMFVNLGKLLLLILAIQRCPVDVPKRLDKLFDAYHSFNKTSDDKVSISIAVGLERIKEADLDDEDDKKKKLIIAEIISIYTKSDFVFPTQSTKIYLISLLKLCDLCETGVLVTVKPRQCGRVAVVYTKDGPQIAEVYLKHCTQCQATIYPCYSERRSNNSIQRKYLDPKMIKVFSITKETFFDCLLLEDLSEDIFTCDVRVTNYVRKYNRVHKSITLNEKRIFREDFILKTLIILYMHPPLPVIEKTF